MSAPDPITMALLEDIGDGDATTKYFVPADLPGVGRIVTREPCVVAGTATAAEVFRRVDAGLRVEIVQADGTKLVAGKVILEVRGAAASILTAERVALNFLQRLSGIASLTRQFVEGVGNAHAKILDTRKTTPGLRALEKAAVVAGGGTNHRFGLHDMILVKDNHLSAMPAGQDLAQIVKRVRAERPDLRIEVEADQLEQVREFLTIPGIDVILLDNMTPAKIREAVALRRGAVKFEASGGITLQNVAKIAAIGVDFISVGALTHSPRAIDLSLELTHGGA
jgi:nicotinate-nucleotide pyrophosphorylase (carboxylating)